jgi:hypothetical protein
MSATATLSRRRKSGRLAHQASAVLLAGCAPAATEQLERLCAHLDLITAHSTTFDETVRTLQHKDFALWILDARRLNLEEPMLWAALRFAGEHSHGARAAGCSVPVLVLINAGDRKAISALNAAAATPSITGWNRSGWRLGLQEMPCTDERLEALMARLLADKWANEAPLKKPT